MAGAKDLLTPEARKLLDAEIIPFLAELIPGFDERDGSPGLVYLWLLPEVVRLRERLDSLEDRRAGGGVVSSAPVSEPSAVTPLDDVTLARLLRHPAPHRIVELFPALVERLRAADACLKAAQETSDERWGRIGDLAELLRKTLAFVPEKNSIREDAVAYLARYGL